MSHLSERQYWLIQHPKFGDGPSLERAKSLLAPLQLPAKARLAVTGSNGKGSVCRYLESMLGHLGKRTGVFTSPHVWEIGERFQTAGQPCDSKVLDSAITRVQKIISDTPENEHGAFEVMLATAVQVFNDQGVEAGVFEVGIGGRWDPVREVAAPVAGLTAVELEHTQLLGETRLEIALDKADLAAEGGVLVCADLGDETLMQAVEDHCQGRGVRFVRAAEEPERADAKTDAKTDAQGLSATMRLASGRTKRLYFAMPGLHQLSNAAVAIGMLREWNRIQAEPFTDQVLDAAAIDALENTKLPGRCEYIPGSPPIYLDIAHTPDSAQSFQQHLQSTLEPGRAVLLTGVSEDKKVEQIMPMLAPLADTLVVSRAYHRGAKVERVATALKTIRPDASLIRAETIEQGVLQARQEALRLGVPLVIAGGLFFAMEARAVLMQRSPGDLHFF